MILKSDELASALREKMGDQKQTAFVRTLAKRGIKVNQATISRVLNKQCRRATPKLSRLCRYAGLDIKDFVRKSSPKQSPRLMKALGEVWDGSKAHERWLARVITTAGAAPE